MRLSWFRSLTDPVPHLAEVADLDELARAFAPRAFPRKEAAPLFSFAEWAPGRSRGLDGIAAVHAVVLDLDEVALLDFDRLVAPAVAPIRCLIYSTWSHCMALPRGLASMRVVAPLARPVSADDWPEVWRRAAWHLSAGLADAKCKDASRAYFVPGHPEGAEGSQYFSVRRGPALDPDALAPVPAGAAAPSLAELADLRARLSRRRGQDARALAQRVECLARGEPFADPGERDDALWRLGCELVRAFPAAGEERVAAVFYASLAQMARQAPDGCPGPQQARDKVRRALESEGARLAGDEAEEEARRVELLREAGRDRCYDEAELAVLAGAAGVPDPDRLRWRWVLQQGTRYYVLRLRDERPEYAGPFEAAELPLVAQRDLCAAESAGVQTWELARGKRVPKPAARLAADYGTVAERVVVDLRAQSSSFDGRTLVRAVCPRRPLEPARSQLVEDWLAALGGPSAGKLLDWIAVVTDLDSPCAALYLHGPRDVGKSLLPAGLARIWTDGGPTELEDAMGAWNDAQTSCPLVFGDERVPKDLRGFARTDDLRVLIQGDKRAFRRKWDHTSEVRGALRVVLAANNRSLLSVGDVTDEDVEAIAERLLYVRCQAAARDVLWSVSQERRRALVREDEIARHALWLAGAREVQREGRFLVGGDRDLLVRWMTVGSGLRSAVLSWVAKWLAEPASYGGGGCRVDGDRVLVSAAGLQAGWTSYETAWRPPTVIQVAAALDGLCLPERTGMTGRGHGVLRVLDPEQLRAWCDLSGYDFGELAEAVERAGRQAREAERRAAQ